MDNYYILLHFISVCKDDPTQYDAHIFDKFCDYKMDVSQGLNQSIGFQINLLYFSNLNFRCIAFFMEIAKRIDNRWVLTKKSSCEEWQAFGVGFVILSQNTQTTLLSSFINKTVKTSVINK